MTLCKEENMNETWTVTIDRLPMNLNDLRKATKWAENAMKADDTETAKGKALETGRLPSMPWDGAHLYVVYGIDDYRHRDLNNLSTKGFIDGITSAGVITDDNMYVLSRECAEWERSDSLYTKMTLVRMPPIPRIIKRRKRRAVH